MGALSFTGYVSQDQVKEEELEYTINRITIAKFEEVLHELQGILEMGRYENYELDWNDNLMPVEDKKGNICYPVISEMVDVHEEDYNPIEIYYVDEKGNRVPDPVLYYEGRKKVHSKHFSSEHFNKNIVNSFNKYKVILQANEYKKKYHFHYKNQPKSARIRLSKHMNFLKRRNFNKNKLLYIYKIQLDVLIDLCKNHKTQSSDTGYLMSPSEFTKLQNDVQKRLSLGFKDDNQKDNFQDNQNNHFNNNLSPTYE